MTSALKLAKLESWIDSFQRDAIKDMCTPGTPMYHLDFVLIGAVKRTLSLASGLLSMVKAHNMICARAIIRMQLDTVSRLLAYTYVDNPEAMAMAVIGGAQIKEFKSRNGKKLLDGYLIDQLTKAHPWVRKVYDFTSGYIHFSEKQFFDSIHSICEEGENNLQILIGTVDVKFSEDSWNEIIDCFNQLLTIVEELIKSYAAQKSSYRS